MANRKDWYYRLNVLEDDLDEAFDDLETADQNIVADIGLCRDASNPGEFGGIMSGFSATNTAGLNIKIGTGAGYDDSGRRVATSDDYTITVTNAGDLAIGAGGTPSGASTTPTSGYERWVAIFITYDRLLSDARYDGYNAEVYFDRAESFHFTVSSGAEKVNDQLEDADRPARQSGKLLLADIRLRNVGGTTSVYAVDQTRREVFFNVTATGGAYPLPKVISKGYAREVMKDLLEFYNDHVAGLIDKHAATVVTFTGGQLWADGTGGAMGGATTVQGALDGAVTDLKSTTEVAGAKRVGAKAQTGALATPSMAAASLTAGTLEAQLTQLLTAVNGRAFRGGDTGLAELTPAADGAHLGSGTYSWDAFIRDLTVKGSVITDLVPASSDIELGTDSDPWQHLHVDSIFVTGGDSSIAYVDITTLDSTTAHTHSLGIGASSQRQWTPEGHALRPHEFFDDFMYAGDQSTGNYGYLHTTETAGFPWGFKTVGAATLGADTGVRMELGPTGGVAHLYAGTTIGYGVVMATGYRKNDDYFAGWWNLYNGAAVMFRFLIHDTAANMGAFMGLAHMGVGALPGSGPGAGVTFDPLTMKLWASVKGSGYGGDPVDLGALTTDTWYSIRMWNKDAATMYFQLNGNATVEASADTGDSIQSTDYCLCAEVLQMAAGAQKHLFIDQAFCSDLTRPADQAAW